MIFNSLDAMYIYSRSQKIFVKELYKFCRSTYNAIVYKDSFLLTKLYESTTWTIVDLTYDEDTRFMLNRSRVAYMQYYTTSELHEFAKLRIAEAIQQSMNELSALTPGGTKNKTTTQ